jgi:hypothetical protein
MIDVTGPDLSPLLELTDGVRAWFTNPSVQPLLAQMRITAPVVGTTGWKQREQQLNQGPGQANRVLFIPGTFPDGADEGEQVPPIRRKGVQFRVIATWKRIVTASIWAVDTTDRNNEEKQILACDRLHQLVVAALRWVAVGDFDGTGKVRRDPKQSANMGFGIERLFEFVHQEEVLDLPVNLATGVTPVLTKSPSS